MANTINLGNGQWATKDGNLLAYNDENGNFKPIHLDFTRASTATNVNRLGLLESARTSEPRIDFSDNPNGFLLLEPQSTNLLAYSNDSTNAVWNKYFGSSAVISSTVLSPDNSFNTNIINFDGTNNGQFTRVFTGLTIGVTYTLSFYSKTKVGSSDMYVRVSPFSQINLSSNTTWTRNFYTFTATSTTHIFITVSSQVGSIELYGIQLEALPYATSYIPTEGSTVTRIKDTASKSGLSSLINSTEGTLFLETRALLNLTGSASRTFSVSDGTGSNRVSIGFTPNSEIYCVVQVGGVLVYDAFLNLDITQKTKIAIRWKANDFATYINGSLVENQLSGVSFSNNILNRIGFDSAAGSDVFYSKTYNMQCFKNGLSNSELITLTTI